MSKIGVLGSGKVGEVLANGLLNLGHEVCRGSSDPQKLNDWVASGRGTAATFKECAAFGEIVILAVKGTAAVTVLDLAGAENLNGKVVIDATNPIADEPPENGVLRYFTGPNDSLMEQLQKKFPLARFVKAFSCVGSAYMVNPNFGGVKPTMFICGNDSSAKTAVVGLLDTLGWESEDVGKAESARAIEPLCILWCAPGFLNGRWNHAFKLLKQNS